MEIPEHVTIHKERNFNLVSNLGRNHSFTRFVIIYSHRKVFNFLPFLILQIKVCLKRLHELSKVMVEANRPRSFPAGRPYI